MSVADEGANDAAAAERAETKPILRDYIETILICVIFVIFSRAFVFQQSKIPSGSMMDTLLIGDYIMVNRFVYATDASGPLGSVLPVRPIQRGDVVVFKKPQEPETDFIKRVIGLPGDLLELRGGSVWVNGERLSEPYVEEAYRRGNYDYGPVRVEPDRYFVMGDHRNASSDSREWGSVPRELMKGRALLIWWSYEEEPGRIYMSLPERLKSWGGKIAHFFTRSRWHRCFRLIR